MDEMENFSLDGFQTVHINTGGMLREWRVVNGLTQQQVAEKAGITQQQYLRFESGSRDLRRCSFQIACQVLEAMNIDIVKFLVNRNLNDIRYLCKNIIAISPNGLDIKNEIRSEERR